ncbi:uncharacterized protein LOC119008054 [Acanthopagrus latus]|uniref:uncharacterized protein LOC119008054 n=1 Tax=Acanthopagrus latus TaxID=8177 RepID=UPI00187C1C39|nr:uncharacterized protein LOC119008054 [Acanthopagrus latus]
MELTGTGNLRSAVGGASDISASYSELLARSSKKTRDNCSLPSSPYPGGRRRLPCSLPCSPQLRGRHWRSSPIPTSPPPCLSRLLVEAALQRSKNIQPSPPRSPQMRPEQQEEQMRGSLGETEENSEGEKQSDEDKVSAVKIFGIRQSDTVIFRPLTSPGVHGREDEEEEKKQEEQQEEQQEEDSRYCLLTPCVCFRCPSAPPYEAQVFSAGDVQTVSSFSSDGQKHSSLTKLSHRTDIMRSDTTRTNDHRAEGGSEKSLYRDKVPWLGESSHLYPSLSLFRTDSQTELNRKQEMNCFYIIQSCFHDNNTDVHLQRLCEVISAPDNSCQTQKPKHEIPLQKLRE